MFFLKTNQKPHLKLLSLQLLFQLIIDYLSDFSFTPAVFEMITEQLKKTYFNILIKSDTLAKWVLGEGKKRLHSECWGWAEGLRNRCSWRLVLGFACGSESSSSSATSVSAMQDRLDTQELPFCSDCSWQQVGRISPQQRSWGPNPCLQYDPESKMGSLTLNSSWQPLVLFSVLHCRDVRLLILEHGRWSMIDKYQTLMNGLSIESLSSFVKAFKSQLFVEGLVQGNFTSRVSTASAADTNSNLFLRCFSTVTTALALTCQLVPLLCGHLEVHVVSDSPGMPVWVSCWGADSLSRVLGDSGIWI